MQNENLPTEELKKFGIINEDLSFSKKLNADDIQKFLQGYTIVADNDKNRATFQLTENNSKLKVIFLERDKNLSEILEKSKENIQYSETKAQYNVHDNRHSAQLGFSKQAFVFDKETNTIKELDFIKNAPELTIIVLERKNPEEINQYKLELEKKSFLQDKIDLYPEIAKKITSDLNIVSREIESVNSITPDEKQIAKENNSDVHLNVNDRDMYEDTNRNREEQEEQSEEQEEQSEEQEKSRKFRR